jgi:hypothetical protein
MIALGRFRPGVTGENRTKQACRAIGRKRPEAVAQVISGELTAAEFLSGIAMQIYGGGLERRWE